MDWLGLGGRRALVLGAGGIGGACARALAEAGASTVAVDVDTGCLDALADAGLRAAIAADLRTAPACREAVEQAARVLGGLDVLVHAVGTNVRLPALRLTDEHWEDVLRVNLDTAFWTGQAAGRLMCGQRYGRIVFVSSVSGLLAHPDHAAYAASKGGMNQMLRVMAREWAPRSVTVNAVAPGYTETDLTRKYLDRPGMRERLTALVPAGRLGSVADLLGPVLFLASDRAGFVTGQVLYADGGRTLV